MHDLLLSWIPYDPVFSIEMQEHVEAVVKTCQNQFAITWCGQAHNRWVFSICMPVNKWKWQRMLIWSILTFGSLRFECPLILFHRCLRWMSAHLMLNSVSDLWNLGLFYQGPADKNMKKTGGFPHWMTWTKQRHEIWEPSQGDSIHVVDSWEFASVGFCNSRSVACLLRKTPAQESCWMCCILLGWTIHFNFGWQGANLTSYFQQWQKAIDPMLAMPRLPVVTEKVADVLLLMSWTFTT